MRDIGRYRRWALASVSGAALLLVGGGASAAIITATWDGGAGSWAQSALWTPDGVPNNTATNQFNARIDGGKAGASPVTLNTTVTIDSLTVDLGDSLSFSTNRAMTIVKAAARPLSGKITNNGTITLNSAPAAVAHTSLLISGGDVDLTGSGKIVLNTTSATLIDPALAARILGGAGAGRLTQASTHTIEGAGRIGDNSMAFTNNGTVNANRAGRTLIIDPNATGAINSSTMKATSGGILVLRNGTFTNTGGTIDAQDMSRVDLDGATIVGGTVTSGGSGVVRAVTATLDGITNDGAIEASDLGLITIRNTIINNGSITLKNLGDPSDLVVDGDATLDGTGSVILEPSAFPNRILGQDGTQTLTNAASHNIQGGGTVGGGNLNLINLGTIEASSGGTLELNMAGTAFTNDGTLRASSGTLKSLDTTVTNKGTVDVQLGSSFTHTVGGATYNQDAGSTTIEGSMVTGTYKQNGGTTSVNGSLTADVQVNGGVLNGVGEVIGLVTNLAGKVAPGLSPGILKVGGYDAGSASVLEIQIFGDTIPGFDFDVLEVGALSATLDGTLEVVVGGGFESLIAVGDMFQILTASGGRFGIFDAIIDNIAGFHFEAIYGANDVTLKFVRDGSGGGGGRVPEPGTLALLGFGLVGIGAVAWHRRQQKGSA